MMSDNHKLSKITLTIPYENIEDFEEEYDFNEGCPQRRTTMSFVEKMGVGIHHCPIKTFYLKSYNNVPDKIYFNSKKKSTVLLKDDKAYKVKCGEKEKFSKRYGFLEAYFQMTSGMSKTKALKYLEDLENNELYEQ